MLFALCPTISISFWNKSRTTASLFLCKSSERNTRCILILLISAWAVYFREHLRLKLLKMKHILCIYSVIFILTRLSWLKQNGKKKALLGKRLKKFLIIPIVKSPRLSRKDRG